MIKTDIQRLYSQWGQAEFHITYDGEDPDDPSYVPTWRLTQLRVRNFSTTAVVRLAVYAATDHSVLLIYDGAPGEDRTQSIPEGQDYYLDQYSWGFGFLDPRGQVITGSDKPHGRLK